MRAAPKSSDEYSSDEYEYQVGGSLPETARTYVERQADSDLCEGLRTGKCCYVLNSRQMGKSSLRVRTMKTLKTEGFACASIEMRDLCAHQITQDDFYGGFVTRLMNEFNLEVNVGDWWHKHNHMSSSERLRMFVENELLDKVTRKIVIFVDEIDSVVRLDFKDDFFAFVRGCYEKRAYKPQYRRLVFALLGVATPADLIKDKNNPPFDIESQAIELIGIKLDKAGPLAEPLERRWGKEVSNPQAVLEEVLKWTGGQPFLTQWICQLVYTNFSPVSAEPLAKSIDDIVRTRVIDNWLIHDKQQHLRTIRKRLLDNNPHTIGLLELYKEILQLGSIAVDKYINFNNQLEFIMELRLCGLVLQHLGQLRIYNPIYASIFTENWVDEELARVRPYATRIEAWFESNCQDKSQLLREQDLEDALAWRDDDDKILSIRDYKFLSDSQKLELTEEKQKSERQIHKEKQKAKRQIFTWFTSSTAVFIGAVIVMLLVFNALTTAAHIQQLNLESKNYLVSNQQLEALIASVRAGRQLQGTIGLQYNKELKYQTASTLLPIINTIVESNRLEGHNKVHSVSFSPDGKTFAAAIEEKTVRIWSLDGQDLNHLDTHNNNEVYSVSFSPDGKTIAAASEDKTVKLWSWDSKKAEAKELTPLTGHTNKVKSVSFSSDSKTIASASEDKTVRIWSLDGKKINHLDTHNNEVYSVSFSPDGKTIAAASEDKTVKLWSWDGKEAKELTPLTGHTDKVRSVSFSPDSKTIASASEDYTVKLWSWDGKKAKELKPPLTGQNDRVWSVSFSADGETIATAGSDKTIKLWTKHGALLKTFKGHTDRVTSVSFSNDGKTIATASFDKTIRLWKIGSLPSVLQRHTDEVYSVSFSHDGKTIASASKDKTFQLWSWDGKEAKELPTPLKAHTDRVWSVRFSPNDRMIATASWDTTVKLWSWNGKEAKELTPPLKGHTGQVFGISFHPNKPTIASVGSDKKVILWDLNNKEIIYCWNSKHEGNVVDVSFSQDGKTIATASDDKTVKLWPYPDEKLLKTYNKCLNNYEHPKTLTGHSDEVNGVSFSPDGNIIATASDDKTVKLWSWDGKEAKELPTPLKGHNERVMNVRITNYKDKDKKPLVATASFDTTVKLWKLDGTLLQTLLGHSNWVWDVSFSPDSNTLASASKDKTIRLWPLNSIKKQSSELGVLLTEGCKWLHDYLRTHSDIEEKDGHIC